MTWLDVALYGPGWLACLLIVLGPWLDRAHDRRFKQQYQERWGVPYDEPKEQQ